MALQHKHVACDLIHRCDSAVQVDIPEANVLIQISSHAGSLCIHALQLATYSNS
jgi:hypothetical protein